MFLTSWTPNQRKSLIIISPLQVRTMNDQLMYLERAFIDPLGLPGRPFYRLFTHMHDANWYFLEQQLANVTENVDCIFYMEKNTEESL